MTKHDRRAVVVLGMHRSGTSAVAGAAVRLGLAGPRTPVPPASDNPQGFYESLPVVMMNHKLMRAADCAWNVCLTFDPDRCVHLPEADRRLIGDILRTEFSDPAGLVLKDPRLCLTLPAWLPALRSECTQMCVLIVARHPGEVVRSLAARDGLPEAETAPHWLHHMLEAERLTRGMDRAVVFYDDLLRDWRRCLTHAASQANFHWPNPIERVEREISAFLGAPPRHHEIRDWGTSVGPPPVRDLMHAAWIALRRLADNLQASAPLACLDEVRGQFADWRGKMFPPGFKAVFPDGAGAGSGQRAL